jgi:hypothetical protein
MGWDKREGELATHKLRWKLEFQGILNRGANPNRTSSDR